MMPSTDVNKFADVIFGITQKTAFYYIIKLSDNV